MIRAFFVLLMLVTIAFTGMAIYNLFVFHTFDAGAVGTTLIGLTSLPFVHDKLGHFIDSKWGNADDVPSGS